MQQRDIQKLPQALGFSDYAHFAKTFKRLTGMTPNSLTDLIFVHRNILKILLVLAELFCYNIFC